jgi:hypothetical protein
MSPNKKRPTAAERRDFEKRATDARKSLERLQAEIAPFIRRRPVVENSTAGKWRQSSSLIGGHWDSQE